MRLSGIFRRRTGRFTARAGAVVFAVAGMAALAQGAKPVVLTVGGAHGKYRQVQAAVNAAAAFDGRPVEIKIAPGTYHELVLVPSHDRNLTLRGAGAKSTIITFNLGAKDKGPSGKSFGTFHTSTGTILGRRITAGGISFVNSYGKGSQAVAVRTGDGPVIFRHCRFIAWQDTLYVHNPRARIYFSHCFIQGAIDFIFGKSIAVFNHCVIRTVSTVPGTCLTAPATPKSQRYGLVFLHCRVKAGKQVKKGSVYLGRPWRKYGATLLVDCHLPAAIAPAGWRNWEGTDYYKTARFAEFNSTGPGAHAGRRAAWSHQLSAATAKTLTPRSILGPGNW